MSISAVGAGSATAIASSAPDDVVSMLVLKKAMAAGASTTLDLLSSLPPLEAHKGKAIDVRV